MKIDRQTRKSRHTETSMEIVRYGDRGVPIVYLPTSGGDQTEFERYGMPEDCKARIEAGKIQFFSVAAGGPATLFNPAIAPPERIARYVRFEHYVVDEVLPHVISEAASGPPVLVGVSYGAFMAANILLRYPGAIRVACGLGGVYGMWHCLDGFHDDAVYFHTPLEYLPRLDDPSILSSIRRTRGLVMYAAEDDSWLASSIQLARVLRDKELPFELDVWKSPANHHEHWWKQQLQLFLQRYD